MLLKETGHPLIAPFNSSESFIVTNPEAFRRKLRGFRAAGLDNIQVVSDFDATLTRARVGSYPGKTSITIAQNTESSPKRQELIKQLIGYYHPIEMATGISDGVKAEFMKEWWGRSSEILVNDRYDENTLEQIVFQSKVFFRSGIEGLLQLCEDYEMPFFIVSAGLGNVIEIFMKSLAAKPLLKVFSNYLVEDSEGKLTIITEPCIVSIEKYLVLAGRQLRSHVLLLGDIPSVRNS
jgi:HAD superfamily hydrolase (TIGR01544 family)